MTLKTKTDLPICAITSLGRYLELTLPKFSLTAVTDLRSVLSEMAVEKYLMGSDANFRRLSSKENFTVDKVQFCLEQESAPAEFDVTLRFDQLLNLQITSAFLTNIVIMFPFITEKRIPTVICRLCASFHLTGSQQSCV